jgi:16S rRNA (cytidine1402-2'-O)-methyltransferase
LYVVATPIGNAEDISARAKRILSEADIVAAEDTRTTQKLLAILDIRNKTVSNHKFNEKTKQDFLLSELENGKNVALVSDAGTPCISDPGGIIVKAAAEHGINIVGISGASAVITALSVCGFCFDSFAFFGFLPRSAGEIKKAIDKARKSGVEASVFFESPKRIKRSLEVFINEVPEAALCLCNDLTKMFERVYRGTPQEILEELLANPSAEKGEYTLAACLSASAGPVSEKDQLPRAMLPEALLIDHVVKHGGSIKDAVKALAETQRHNFSKKDFYSASLNLRKIVSELFPNA